MVTTVNGPAPGLGQLITTRKVGRPQRDRPAGSGTSARAKAPTGEADPEITFYGSVPGEGVRLQRDVPTGQYVDTYA